MKRCSTCGETLPLDAFHRNGSRRDGLKQQCKSCVIEYMRTHREANLEKYRERDRERMCKQYAANPEKYRERMRTHREANPEKHREYKRKYRKARYALVLEAKSRPCVDCGGCFPPEVMDLDHVRGEKKFALSQIDGRPIQDVIDEIAKCEPRCANCHRIETAKRRNDYLTRTKIG